MPCKPLNETQLWKGKLKSSKLTLSMGWRTTEFNSSRISPKGDNLSEKYQSYSTKYWQDARLRAKLYRESQKIESLLVLKT